MATAPREHVSIHEAAQILDVSPWDVVELIETGQLLTTRVVDLDSLRTYQEGQS